MDTFTTPQMAKIIGEPMRKLLSFIERGYVTPSIQDASGHGSRRQWSYLDVIRCLLVQRLLRSGFNVERLRELASEMTDEQLPPNMAWKIWEDDVKGVKVMTEGWTRPSEKLEFLLTDEDFERFPDLHVVSIKALHELARKRIDEVP